MKNLNDQEVKAVLNKSELFPQGDQVAFFRMQSKTMVYLPRLWIVNNQQEYMDLMHYICNIDMIVNPEVKSFPQKYELINNKNIPDLKPINN